jgi:predicted lactoylglutathione lyase
MIGFAMLGTNDLARARGFHDRLMPLLGASVNTGWSTERRVWYVAAPDAPMLAVTAPYDGQPATAGNGSMIALTVASRAAVHAVHAEAVALGGADEGGPGHRSRDPGDLYRAYFRDLDGNKLMVFTLAPD